MKITAQEEYGAPLPPPASQKRRRGASDDGAGSRGERGHFSRVREKLLYQLSKADSPSPSGGFAAAFVSNDVPKTSP